MGRFHRSGIVIAIPSRVSHGFLAAHITVDHRIQISIPAKTGSQSDLRIDEPVL